MLAGIDPSSIRPLRRKEYDQLVQLGLFEDEKVELLHGMVVRMTPIGPEHTASVDRLTELFVLALHGRARIRVQGPIAASDDSEPEPDLTVLPPGDYWTDHPSVAWLVIEVAESSLPVDRKVKAPLYAAQRVPEYWIVNLVDRVIEVYTGPQNGAYATARVYRRGDVITLERFPDVSIHVTDMLPP